MVAANAFAVPGFAEKLPMGRTTPANEAQAVNVRPAVHAAAVRRAPNALQQAFIFVMAHSRDGAARPFRRLANAHARPDAHN